jgi:hypothetical protein
MSEPSLTTLIIETTADQECPIKFLGDTSDIVYFISFAHSERYGSEHPLAKAATILKRQLRVNLSPLLTFADARTESEAEKRILETLWQDAAPLADSASRVANAIQNTTSLQNLTADFPHLPDRLHELAEMTAWAAQRGATVRLTYLI